MYDYRKTRYIVYLTALIVTTVLHAGEIHDAAATGDLGKVRTLLEADSTLLEAKDENGSTPLICACFAPPAFISKSDIANYLIDRGANIHAKNNWGATPLYFTIGDYDLTLRLIKMGAAVNVKVFGSITPVNQAASRGNLKVTKLLIDHGANINLRSEQGTLVHRIINMNQIEKNGSCTEMVKLLVEGGIKLEEYSFGNTELHLAAIQGLTDLVPILIKAGCDVNVVNHYGHTPLYYAAIHGFQKTAEALIAAGADTTAIVEKNYGKAPQLTSKLKQREAYLWYLGGAAPGTGYVVKTKNNLLIFDPPHIGESTKAKLVNGLLNPNELKNQKITIMITRKRRFDETWFIPRFSILAKHFPNADFILGFQPTVDSTETTPLPPYRLARPHETFSVDGIRVHTIQSTCQHHLARYINYNFGLGYLVEVDGVKLFQAGLHSSDNDSTRLTKYKKGIDCLKPFGPIDFAILPIGGHHMSAAYEPYLYLIDQLTPKAIYLIGSDWDTEEHKKCITVLETRDVPVFYPDGGIAKGQRFHYVHN